MWYRFSVKGALIAILFLVLGAGSYFVLANTKHSPYGAPPYISEENVPDRLIPDFSNWKRPEGPLRVGLQVGHWKNSELPDEFARLRESGGGTSNGKLAEWEVILAIAQAAKPLLEAQGIVVDILPATIPPGYWADAFVAIHADGSTQSDTTGYKVAAPRRDMTGYAKELVTIMESAYESATGLVKDPNITRNMTGYYAFSWRRYEHAIHPMTPAIILETGFLTNPSDAKLLIHSPHIPAQAITSALLTFLKTQ